MWQHDLGRHRQVTYARIVAWVAWLTCLAPVAAVSAGQPSNTEQLWLQIVNRFRTSPAEELDRLVNYREQGTGLEWGVPISDDRIVADNLEFFRVDPAVLRAQFQPLQPAPPLVWSEQLHDSAEYYSHVMIQRDQQSHNLDQYTGVFGLLDRLQAEGGYDFSAGGGAAENLFAFAEDVIHGHAALVLDWGSTPTGIQDPPGHRQNLLDPVLREIGIAVVEVDDPSAQVGPWVVTQHLAVDFSDGPFLTGVVYADQDANDFYSPGEGFGELILALQNVENKTIAASAVTYRSGGFRLDLSRVTPGTYQIVLQDSEPIFWSAEFEIPDADENVALNIQDPQYDIDSISRLVREGRYWSPVDLNADGTLTVADRTLLIEEVYRTYLGDANLDGRFNSSDFVSVIAAGEFEDSLPQNSRWTTGDWDGDGDFTTTDLVVALSAGGYEQGPRAVIKAVPEPPGDFVFRLAALGLLRWTNVKSSVRRLGLRGVALAK